MKLLNPDYIEDIRSAATKMHGSERRSFMAEMTLKHCGGNPRRAETAGLFNSQVDLLKNIFYKR